MKFKIILNIILVKFRNKHYKLFINEGLISRENE